MRETGQNIGSLPRKSWGLTGMPTCTGRNTLCQNRQGVGLTSEKNKIKWSKGNENQQTQHNTVVWLHMLYWTYTLTICMWHIPGTEIGTSSTEVWTTPCLWRWRTLRNRRRWVFPANRSDPSPSLCLGQAWASTAVKWAGLPKSPPRMKSLYKKNIYNDFITQILVN